jgi:hypothetical protein
MNEKFPRSFIPRELRTADAECSYKRHCRGVVREVIGYLDLQAKRDATGERFVFCHVNDVVAHCKRYKGEAYGKRAVEYALGFLLHKHAISRRLKRRRAGALREGWIVTPHDALFTRAKSICSYVGRKVPETRYRRDPVSRSWFWIQRIA